MKKPTNIPELIRAHALFDEIHIQHPRIQHIHDTFDYMREMGKAKKGPRAKHKGIRILGPSFSGKTRSIESYRALNGMDDDDFTVLHVELQQNATPKRLWIDILTAFGDGFATLGTEEVVKRRAQQYLRELTVELIVFDEVQQLTRKGSSAVAWDVSEALKRFIDEGYAPVALVGADEALPIFKANPQLVNRLTSPIDMSPLDATNEEDRFLFCGYCGRLDERMVDIGCVSQSSDLMSPFILKGLYHVSNGILGNINTLIRVAIEVACRRDRKYILVSDLALAVDRWAIPNGTCDFNPFTEGPDEKDRKSGLWQL